MKYYVVADIHGFYTQLKETLTKKGYFEDTEPHKLVICGDLFDRGLETGQVQDFVGELLERDEVILIRGNHEDLLEELSDNLELWLGYGLNGSHHDQNGTLRTLLYFADMSFNDMFALPKLARNRYHQTLFYRKILPAMRDYFETKSHIFVHGWIPCYKFGERYLPMPGWREASDEMWRDARWYNGMQAAFCGVREPGKTIVCGHYHTSFGHAMLEGKGSEYGSDADFSPYYADGIIAIDACTSFSKTMNCIVIEDEPLG